MISTFRCGKGLFFIRDCNCELLTHLALKNPDKFISCHDCECKIPDVNGDYVCITDRVPELDEFNKENVPDEIVIRIPIQFAVDLSDSLMRNESLFYPLERFNTVLFSALEEQFYKVAAPETYKRIHEILEKGDEDD